MGFAGHIANHIVLRGRLFAQVGPQPLAKNLLRQEQGRGSPRKLRGRGRPYQFALQSG
jgi:hypothetical protein